MDIINARILMRKINSLFRSVDQDDAQPSPIERDLMLSYLRQLYALFLEDDVQTSAPKAEISRTTTPAPAAEEPKPAEQPLPVQDPPVPTPPVHTPPPVQHPPVATPPVHTPPPVKEDPPATTPSPKAETPVLPPKPALSQPSAAGSSQLMEQLFAFKRATELSERLSESPVADLARAMSINDRLLYINELFGRDRSALEDSLTVLNRFDSFQAARSFLVSLAEQYHWAQEERMEIAQNFIKLVRRRYPQ